MNIAMAAFPVLKAAKNVAGLRGLFKAAGYADRACNSFVGGTRIETPEGPKPIELVEEGDVVLTRPQEQPGAPPIIGRVTGVFRNLAPAVLWLTLSTGQVVGVTPTHEFWTYECGWTLAGELHVGETLTGLDGEPMAIVSIVVDPRPAPVYNLEVDRTATFFADRVWVHNNRCQLVFEFHHLLPKFLGGLENGKLALLDEVLHRQYHGGLLAALANAGLHRRRNQSWKDFFEHNEGTLNTALDTLVTYTRNFDGQQGTSLLEHVMNAIK
jgi:hypothetical protein